MLGIGLFDLRQSLGTNRKQSPLLALQVALPREPVKPRAGFMLSDKALQDFKALWKREFGEDISDDFAMEKATKLLALFGAIYRPLKKDWLEESKQPV